MPETGFDSYSHNYRETLKASISFSGKGDEFFDSFKIYYIKKWVANDNRAYDILDFGCGIGKLTGLLAKEFQQSLVYGHDISKKSLNVAREESAGLKNVCFVDSLPEDKKYDFIIVANVFHHINHSEHANTLLKIKEFLKPDGKIVIFEHNPFNPLTRYVVNTCPFDADARLIYQHKFTKLIKICGMKVELKPYIVFFPWPSGIFRMLENLLRHVPLGAQYMLLLTNK